MEMWLYSLSLHWRAPLIVMISSVVLCCLPRCCEDDTVLDGFFFSVASSVICFKRIVMINSSLLAFLKQMVSVLRQGKGLKITFHFSQRESLVCFDLMT